VSQALLLSRAQQLSEQQHPSSRALPVLPEQSLSFPAPSSQPASAQSRPIAARALRPVAFQVV
jgi:hypothetical protein